MTAVFAATGSRTPVELGVSAGLDWLFVSNLRWLSGYRHPRRDVAPVSSLLPEMFALPMPLLASAEAIGDPPPSPQVV